MSEIMREVGVENFQELLLTPVFDHNRKMKTGIDENVRARN